MRIFQPREVAPRWRLGDVNKMKMVATMSRTYAARAKSRILIKEWKIEIVTTGAAQTMLKAI